MIIHSEPRFSILFGDKREGFIPRTFSDVTNGQELLKSSPFNWKKTGIDSLLFLHQTHSVQGMYISTLGQAQSLKPFTSEGDYLINSLDHIGIGIATADCLPIILYDKTNHAAAIIHAGWRGSVNRVAPIAFERMQTLIGTSTDNVRVFFGPSAKLCCYKVGPEVSQALENFSFYQEVLYKHGPHLMFDLPLFNQLLLEQAGIAREAFNLAYNICTIHTNSFHSYRREHGLMRQSTIMVLR